MPLNIKGILLHGFFIGEVECLLKYERTEHGKKFLGRTAKSLAKMLADLIDRDRRQDVVAKKPRPSALEHLAPFGGQKVPGIENVELIRISYFDHDFAFNPLNNLSFLYQNPE